MIRRRRKKLQRWKISGKTRREQKRVEKKWQQEEKKGARGEKKQDEDNQACKKGKNVLAIAQAKRNSLRMRVTASYQAIPTQFRIQTDTGRIVQLGMRRVTQFCIAREPSIAASMAFWVDWAHTLPSGQQHYIMSVCESCCQKNAQMYSFNSFCMLNQRLAWCIMSPS